MEFHKQISRKNFLQGSLALTTTLFLGNMTNIVEADRKLTDWPKSPNEATGKTAMKYLFDRTTFEPMQIFDNLYYIGSISVAQFVISSSDGLIMIDSGWDEKDADYAAFSMKKLGLNPKDTKYILLTHGHSDHYGGAQFFKDKYCKHAKIAMNIIDSNWDAVIPKNGPFNGVQPKIDMQLTDKQHIKLGDADIYIILTPGHTPGCMSMIIPVTDHGEKHMVAIWGGTGTPESLEMTYLYLSSVNYFSQFTAKYNVDVEMSAHGWVDNTFDKLEKLRLRKPGEPNPFVIGKTAYKEYELSYKKMAQKVIFASNNKNFPPSLSNNQLTKKR